MAVYGMYGVYYAKCVKKDGVVTGYTGGMKQMGEAISANFERSASQASPLYANNRPKENDTTSGTGGTLTMTLDTLGRDAAADLFGIKVEDVTISDEEASSGLNEEEKKGKALKYTGAEKSAPVGAAYVRQHQIDNDAGYHEVVIYREVVFTPPNEAAQTKGETIEWQTPEITGQVAGEDKNGSPWYESAMFPTLRAALAYIQQTFKESVV